MIIAPPARHLTDDFLHFPAQRSDLSVGEAAELVGAGEEPQGAVLCGGVVEVETEGDHLFENGDGRLNVRTAVFDRPRAEAGNVALLLQLGSLGHGVISTVVYTAILTGHESLFSRDGNTTGSS